jgi:hypothetical protein
MKYNILIILFTLITTISCQGQQTNYDIVKSNTANKRTSFEKRYLENKRNPIKQKEIVKEASNFLLEDINNYFEVWSGTQWDFNGHTQTPKDGKIACGYFITTTLRDMGFKIPRIKWAQLASESMIKNMTTDIKRFHNAPMKDVVDYIQSKGEGLYIVGLDCHVGYIYYYKKKMRFVHSNYYKPQIGVMSEPLVGKNPLNDSKYRIIGKILDKNMVIKWIKNESY